MNSCCIFGRTVAEAIAYFCRMNIKVPDESYSGSEFPAQSDAEEQEQFEEEEEQEEEGARPHDPFDRRHPDAPCQVDTCNPLLGQLQFFCTSVHPAVAGNFTGAIKPSKSTIALFSVSEMSCDSSGCCRSDPSSSALFEVHSFRVGVLFRSIFHLKMDFFHLKMDFFHLKMDFVPPQNGLFSSRFRSSMPFVRGSAVVLFCFFSVPISVIFL